MTTPHPSPLGTQMFRLQFPRSLGTFDSYDEVQTLVDALSDGQFPVENTMIVGTDLKQVERVTGRRTWGRVLGTGVASGLWMGLFVGLLFSFLSGTVLTTVLLSMLMGVVFFTVWSAIGYAMTGGRRDYTSMTATIPMQYELLVEHSHADRARQVLIAAGRGDAISGGTPALERTGSAPRPAFGGHASYGRPAPQEPGSIPGTEPSSAPTDHDGRA